METTTSPREGWVDVAFGDVSVLAEGNPRLADALRGAIVGRNRDDAVEAVLDLLTQAGWRQTRDFAIAAGGAESIRIVVRGGAHAMAVTAEDTYEVRSPSRTPWLDTELAGVTAVHLETGLPEPEPEPVGWAMPSAFGGPRTPAPAAIPADLGAAAIAPDVAPVEETWPGGLPHQEDRARLSADLPGVGAPDGGLGALGAGALGAGAMGALVGAAAGVAAQSWGGERPEPGTEASISAGYGGQAPGLAEYTDPEYGTSEYADREYGTSGYGSTEYAAELDEARLDEARLDEAGLDEARLDEGSAADERGAEERMLDEARILSDSDEARLNAAGINPADVVAAAESAVAEAAAAEEAARLSWEAQQPATDWEADERPSEWGSAAPQATWNAAALTWEQPDVRHEGASADGSPGTGPADSRSDATSTGLPSSPVGPTGPAVLAVLCLHGHTSAPHASHCRVCGEPIPPQQAQEVTRPALGTLRFSTGDDVSLDRGVLIGRSPKVATDIPAAHRPHLVRVPSPDNDISRNHAEIILDGWYVLLQDLGSTNGTTLTLPGQEPVRLRPHEQTAIEPGAVFTLAEQVTVTFEVHS